MFERFRRRIAELLKEIAVYRPTEERILDVAKALDVVAEREGNSLQANCTKQIEGLLAAAEWVLAIHFLETVVGELDDVPQGVVDEVAALHRENAAAISELLGE